MIQITGLQKIVGSQTVLEIEDFSVEQGEICAVVGPRGSGKSLLVDLLLGRIRPNLGNIRIANLPDSSPKHATRHIGVLFEENGLYPRQSALENLKFHCKLFDLPDARAKEVLEKIGLQEHAKTRAEKLPEGLARRLAFGRALLHDPAVLLLVEPFTHCDEATIRLISQLVLSFASENGNVLILASDETHLSTLCHRIFRLQHGKLNEVQIAETETARFPFKIPVRLEGKIVLLNPSEILYVDAADGRTQIWTAGGSLQTQFTLSELEERLSRQGFFRAHRSYLVNLQHVKEVIPYTRNSFSLRLNDSAETRIPLSKAAAAELRELLNY